MPQHRILPSEVLQLLLKAELPALVDVRSEGEAAVGSLPGFHCLPILNDQERHQVGLTYKNSGQTEAVELGIELTTPFRNDRIDGWLKELSQAGKSQLVIACWRGGLRSKIACNWLLERDPALDVTQVIGGYKAVRRELLAESEAASPAFCILSGMTGSGKTTLLQFFSQMIDLEGLARHRGSAFGKIPGVAQPSQGNFENHLFFELYRARARGFETVLLEDESAAIGRVNLPSPVKQRMKNSAVVLLEESVEIRAANIARDYIAEQISAGVEAKSLRLAFVASIAQISSKLGGLGASQLTTQIDSAFASREPALASNHMAWISNLLTQYYDPMYAYSFAHHPRPLLFRGNRRECEDWLSPRFARKSV